MINRLLFPAMGFHYWKYKSLAPKVNDIEVMSGALSTFSSCGLTVRELREEIRRLLNHPLSEIDENAAWLDKPLQIYLAELNKGETEEGDTEEMLLKSLIRVEKALSEPHEH